MREIHGFPSERRYRHPRHQTMTVAEACRAIDPQSPPEKFRQQDLKVHSPIRCCRGEHFLDAANISWTRRTLNLEAGRGSRVEREDTRAHGPIGKLAEAWHGNVFIARPFVASDVSFRSRIGLPAPMSQRARARSRFETSETRAGTCIVTRTIRARAEMSSQRSRAARNECE